MIISAQKANKANKGAKCLKSLEIFSRISCALSSQKAHATQELQPFCALNAQRMRMKFVSYFNILDPSCALFAFCALGGLCVRRNPRRQGGGIKQIPVCSAAQPAAARKLQSREFRTGGHLPALGALDGV